MAYILDQKEKSELVLETGNKNVFGDRVSGC